VTVPGRATYVPRYRDCLGLVWKHLVVWVETQTPIVRDAIQALEEALDSKHGLSTAGLQALEGDLSDKLWEAFGLCGGCGTKGLVREKKSILPRSA
jgi:hypothetical protein